MGPCLWICSCFGDWDPPHKENFSAGGGGRDQQSHGSRGQEKGHGVVCQEGSPKSPKQGVSRVTFRMWTGKCLWGTTIMDKYPKSSAGTEHSGVLNTQNILNKPETLEICVKLKGYNFAGIMEMRWVGSCDGLLPWRDSGSFGKGRVGRWRGRFALYRESSWSTGDAAWAWMRSWWKVYGSGLKIRQAKRTRPSTDRQEQPHLCRLWCSLGISTTPVSTGRTTLQGINIPGGSGMNQGQLWGSHVQMARSPEVYLHQILLSWQQKDSEANASKGSRLALWEVNYFGGDCNSNNQSFPHSWPLSWAVSSPTVWNIPSTSHWASLFYMCKSVLGLVVLGCVCRLPWNQICDCS